MAKTNINQKACSVCGMVSQFDAETLKNSIKKINGVELILCTPCEDAIVKEIVLKRFPHLPKELSDELDEDSNEEQDDDITQLGLNQDTNDCCPCEDEKHAKATRIVVITLTDDETDWGGSVTTYCQTDKSDEEINAVFDELLLKYDKYFKASDYHDFPFHWDEIPQTVVKEVMESSDVSFIIATKRDRLMNPLESRTSEWLQSEAGIAFAQNKIIMVLKQRGVKLSGLAGEFPAIQFSKWSLNHLDRYFDDNMGRIRTAIAEKKNTSFLKTILAGTAITGFLGLGAKIVYDWGKRNGKLES